MKNKTLSHYLCVCVYFKHFFIMNMMQALAGERAEFN